MVENSTSYSSIVTILENSSGKPNQALSDSYFVAFPGSVDQAAKQIDFVCCSAVH